VSGRCLLLRVAIHPDEGNRLTGLHLRLGWVQYEELNPSRRSQLHDKPSSTACPVAQRTQSNQEKAVSGPCLLLRVAIHAHEGRFPVSPL
jgi:hypothetical protein